MRKWLIFTVLSLSYILVFFHRLSPAVVAVDMMRDLATSGALLGVLGSAYFYPYALMQLPAGLLADSWGPRRSMTVFFALAAVGGLLCGLAESFGLAVTGRVLVGLGVSMIFVPSMKVYAVWFDRSQFARVGGLFLAMGGVGSFTAATPLAWLSSLIGWRMSLVSVAGLTLLLTGCIWLVVRDAPDTRAPAGPPPAGSGLWAGIRQVAATPAFWPMAGWFFFGNAIFFAFGGLWGGPYLMQVYGLSKADAGQVLSVMSLGIILGSPVLSYLSDKVFHARKPVLVLASLAVVGVTALLAFATADLGPAMLHVVCFGIGFASSLVVLGFTMTKELFPVSIAGTALGFMNIFPFSGGALFQPVLGWVLERHGRAGEAFTPAGYQAAFTCLFAAAVAAFLFALLCRETMVRQK